MLSIWNAFDDLFRFDDPYRSAAFQRESRFTPPMDVFEQNGNYVLKAELPGMKAADVDIRVEGNLLTISGERRSEHKSEDEGYRRVERRFGSFCRSFTLPENVKADQIAADMSEGVLTLTIPKTESARPRKIEVRGETTAGELPKRERVEAKAPRASA